MKIHKPDEIHVVLTNDEFATLGSLLNWVKSKESVEVVHKDRLFAYHQFAAMLLLTMQGSVNLEHGDSNAYRTPVDYWREINPNEGEWHG